MNYKDFEKKVCDFFQERGWKVVDNGEEKYLEKNYNPQVIDYGSKYLLSDINLYKKLKEIFVSNNLELEHVDTVKNKYPDTEFIIAGLQKINDYLYGNKEILPATYHLFQPVIRLNSMEKCGSEEGYISSFVNLCTVDIDTDVEEYLFKVDQWISILSILSLHSSGLKIIFKNSTTTYNGIGLEFNYKGIDLGQANLYMFDIKNKQFYVTDIGFGYERILWILNNLKNFYVPLFPKYEILNGNYLQNDRIRTATLMVMTGIFPEATGTGSKCRKLLKSALINNNINNIDSMVYYYYSYYSKFVTPCLSYENTISVINNEITNLKKRSICLDNNLKYQKEESIEEVCGKILLNKNRRIK